MKKNFYFTNANGEWVKEYAGNIRGARTAARRLANELDEEITINACKNIETDERVENEEYALVCDENADVMAVCGTIGAAQAWCALNGITGDIDENEPFIKIASLKDGLFETEDYASIDEYFGKRVLADDYFVEIETVYPEITEAETSKVTDAEIEMTAEVETTAEVEMTERKRENRMTRNELISKTAGTIISDLTICKDTNRMIKALGGFVDECNANGYSDTYASADWLKVLNAVATKLNGTKYSEKVHTAEAHLAEIRYWKNRLEEKGGV